MGARYGHTTDFVASGPAAHCAYDVMQQCFPSRFRNLHTLRLKYILKLILACGSSILSSECLLCLSTSSGRSAYSCPAINHTVGLSSDLEDKNYLPYQSE